MLLATAGKEAVDDAMRTGDVMTESVVLGQDSLTVSNVFSERFGDGRNNIAPTTSRDGGGSPLSHPFSSPFLFPAVSVGFRLESPRRIGGAVQLFCSLFY